MNDGNLAKSLLPNETVCVQLSSSMYAVDND